MTFETEVGLNGKVFFNHREDSVNGTQKNRQFWKELWPFHRKPKEAKRHFTKNVPFYIGQDASNTQNYPADYQGPADAEGGIDLGFVNPDLRVTDFQELEGNLELGPNDSGVGGFGGTFEGSAGDDRDGD